MDYQSLRAFADSWGLLFMVVAFAVMLWLVLRPSARQHHEDARMIPFRDDEAE